MSKSDLPVLLVVEDDEGLQRQLKWAYEDYTVVAATDRAQATGDGRVWAIIGEGRIGWWRDAPSGFEPLSYTLCGV